MSISDVGIAPTLQNKIFVALAVGATILFYWAATHPHSPEMGYLLGLIQHRSHIDDVGREHHFEQLATETMWRFVFHAMTIGWCVAISIAYLFAKGERQAIGLDMHSTAEATALMEAMARNPLAFVSLPEDAGDSAIASVLTFKSKLEDALQVQSVSSQTTKERQLSGLLARPMDWIQNGGDRRKIMVVGFIGLVLLLVGYLIKRPSL